MSSLQQEEPLRERIQKQLKIEGGKRIIPVLLLLSIIIIIVIIFTVVYDKKHHRKYYKEAKPQKILL